MVFPLDCRKFIMFFRSMEGLIHIFWGFDLQNLGQDNPFTLPSPGSRQNKYPHLGVSLIHGYT